MPYSLSSRSRGRSGVIAHRGASAVALENTVEAFRMAKELGADWVELDVRWTADDCAVVHHDATISGRALAELRHRDLPSHVVELDVALDACAGMGVNVEVKNDPTEIGYRPAESFVESLGELLAQRPFGQAVLLSSFDLPTLHVLLSRLGLPTGWLIYAPLDPFAAVALAAAAGHVAINPHHRQVSEAVVEAAHERGLAVNVWTVDDPARLALLWSWGVDGLITNKPDVARAVVDRQGQGTTTRSDS